jgi:hypothetical protein
MVPVERRQVRQPITKFRLVDNSAFAPLQSVDEYPEQLIAHVVQNRGRATKFRSVLTPPVKPIERKNFRFNTDALLTPENVQMATAALGTFATLDIFDANKTGPVESGFRKHILPTLRGLLGLTRRATDLSGVEFLKPKKTQAPDDDSLYLFGVDGSFIGRGLKKILNTPWRGEIQLTQDEIEERARKEAPVNGFFSVVGMMVLGYVALAALVGPGDVSGWEYQEVKPITVSVPDNECGVLGHHLHTIGMWEQKNGGIKALAYLYDLDAETIRELNPTVGEETYLGQQILVPDMSLGCGDLR